MKLAIRSTLYVVVLTVLLGGAYPAAVWAVSRLFWKDKADGSFVTAGGRVVGSELIGQNFKGPRYLHPRPSAAGKDGYDATASGARTRGRPTPTSRRRSRRPWPRRARTARATRAPSPRTW